MAFLCLFYLGDNWDMAVVEKRIKQIMDRYPLPSDMRERMLGQIIAVINEPEEETLDWIEFSVWRLPPSLNVMFRQHWSVRHREQEAWDKIIYLEWLRNGRVVFDVPVKIKYRLFFRHRRGRDYDNYVGGTKYITDALKRTFITRDDAEWVKGIEVFFAEDREGIGERTLITLLPVVQKKRVLPEGGRICGSPEARE